MFLFIVQLLIVLAALYVGARYSSIALASISGLGLAILIFGFGMKPGNPPSDVIYIIVAAITCASLLQSAGGMDWLIQLAEKLLRKHPERITVLAPLSTFFLTVFVGTGHVVYTIMPIIADISLKKGIRPERPCAVASVASQVGIICSPIAAAVVAFVTISGENGFDVSILQVVSVTLPSCLVGLICAALLSRHRGLDLDKDPEFLRRLADPEQRKLIYEGDGATTMDKEIGPKAKASVFVFLGALVCIVLMGALGFKAVKMTYVIQIVLLCASALMLIFCGASSKAAVNGSVFKSGMTAVVAIFGVAWLADTFFGGYMTQMANGLGEIVKHFPWAISFVFFTVSVLINSQGATVLAILPLAYTLGIPGPILLGVLPSVYGYFFIPNYPSDLATINFDHSGTTRIGKYLLNHSFMMPGMVCTVVSTLVGLGIVQFIHF